MERILVLLTKSYPYDSGEEFLENEIQILSNSFSRVFIIATSVNDTERISRRVPENAVCLAIKGISNTGLKYGRYIISGIPYILINKELKDEIINSKSIAAKLACVYFYGRCHWLLNKIIDNEIIIETLKQKCSRIVYSYWFSDLPYLALLLKRRLNVNELRIVSRAHGYDLYEERNPGRCIPFRKAVFNGIYKVYPCSMNGEEYLINRYPEYKNKIKCSYLGTIDHGKAVGKSSDCFHLATCSSIIPLKRLDLIVDAVSILESEGIIVKWTCIGDGPLLESIKNETSNKISKSVVRFMGRLKNEQVLDIYKTDGIDVLINVSSMEGLPVSIMEAISFGIPVIATDVGGTSEIVKPGITGLLIQKNITSNDVADCIKKAMTMTWNHECIRDYWNNTFNAVGNYNRFIQDIFDE